MPCGLPDRSMHSVDAQSKKLACMLLLMLLLLLSTPPGKADLSAEYSKALLSTPQPQKWSLLPICFV